MRIVLALALCLVSSSAWAQASRYSLTLLRPLAVGAAGTGLDADNRIYRAYSGITYEFRAAAIGGTWPYSWTLSGEPAGMTVEAGPCTTGTLCTDGTVTWVNPTSSDASITITVRDAVGTEVSATWGVTVSTTIGADGFCFVDADVVPGGTGTLLDPYSTIDEARDGCGARSIMYLRGATADYTYDGIPTFTSECHVTGPTADGLSVSFTETSQPVIWLGYPGESPVVDLQYTGASNFPCAELTGDNIEIQGITFTRCPGKCFDFHRTNRFGATFRENTCDGQVSGYDGGNSGCIMYSALYDIGLPNTQAYFDVNLNNTCTNWAIGAGGVTSCFKFYSTRQALEADNTYTTVESEETVAWKSDDSQFTSRGSVFTSITGRAFGGNMHMVVDETYGEYLYNNIKDSSVGCFRFNQDGQTTTEVDIYRNTCQGEILIANVDATSGPWTFTANVIVNDGGSGGTCPERLTCSNVTDASRIVLTSNLQGAAADGIVNAAGELQGAYLIWLGSRGWQIGAGASTGPIRIRLTGM